MLFEELSSIWQSGHDSFSIKMDLKVFVPSPVETRVEVFLLEDNSTKGGGSSRKACPPMRITAGVGAGAVSSGVGEVVVDTWASFCFKGGRVKSFFKEDEGFSLVLRASFLEEVGFFVLVASMRKKRNGRFQNLFFIFPHLR